MTALVDLKLVIANHFRRWAFMPGMFINRSKVLITLPKHFAGPKYYCFNSCTFYIKYLR